MSADARPDRHGGRTAARTALVLYGAPLSRLSMFCYDVRIGPAGVPFLTTQICFVILSIVMAVSLSCDSAWLR